MDIHGWMVESKAERNDHDRFVFDWASQNLGLLRLFGIQIPSSYIIFTKLTIITIQLHNYHHNSE